MRILLALVSLLVLSPFLYTAEPIKSGPQVGAKVPGPFEPFNINGANADEECCLYCKFGNDPVVMIFARDMSEPLTVLLKKVDALNAKYKKQDLGTCAIFVEKATGLRPALKVVATKAELKNLIIGTLDAPPKGYDIHNDADVTVMFYVGSTVKANHAFRKGEFNEKVIDEVLKDVSKIVK